jgi:cell division septal protein FtsQ
MKGWLQKLTRKTNGSGDNSRFTGGVDSGRDVFVQATQKETRQKKNLLKKLNLYWSRKRVTSQVGFQDKERTSDWRRKILLVAGLIGVIALFIQIDGPDNIRRSLENLAYFNITSIEVSGIVRGSADQVRAASGVSVSTSQFSVDREAVRAAIRAGNDWVKDAKISRYWPDKLVIRVTEHEPHALIAIKNNGQASLYYLNREGEPFTKATHGMDLDFPIITGLETEQDQEIFREKLRQSLYFLRLAQKNDPNLPAQSLSEIHIDPEEGLVLHLVEYPFPIFLGKEDIRKKYVRLRKILEVLYKPRKMGMDINRVAYIRMDYLKDKAIVGYSESG